MSENKDGYRFNLDALPERDWIGMTETHRLPGEPSKPTLWRWTTIGRPVGNGRRLKLPTFQQGSTRRYTTIEAYEWWKRQLARAARLIRIRPAPAQSPRPSAHCER